MARPDIRMSDAEVAAFLGGKSRAAVGTLDPAGAPDGEPAEFACADGAITFTVPTGGSLHGHLRRAGRAVCSLEEFPSYAEIRGVTIHGRVTLVADDGSRATFRFDRPRIESFDFRKARRT